MGNLYDDTPSQDYLYADQLHMRELNQEKKESTVSKFINAKTIGLALAIIIVIVLVVLAFKLNKESFDPEILYAENPDVVEKGEVTAEDFGLNDNSWGTQIMQMGLDPDVVVSHKKFVNDAAKITSTASNKPIRGDDNHVLPWIGLRRPNYNVLVGDGARTVPTVEADQLPTATSFLI